MATRFFHPDGRAWYVCVRSILRPLCLLVTDCRVPKHAQPLLLQGAYCCGMKLVYACNKAKRAVLHLSVAVHHEAGLKIPCHDHQSSHKPSLPLPRCVCHSSPSLVAFTRARSQQVILTQACQELHTDPPGTGSILDPILPFIANPKFICMFAFRRAGDAAL